MPIASSATQVAETNLIDLNDERPARTDASTSKHYEALERFYSLCRLDSTRWNQELGYKNEPSQQIATGVDAQADHEDDRLRDEEQFERQYRLLGDLGAVNENWWSSGGTRYASRLVARMSREWHPETLVSGAEALAAIGQSAILPIVQSLGEVASLDVDQMIAFLRALGWIGEDGRPDASAKAVIVNALASEEPEVQEAAVYASQILPEDVRRQILTESELRSTEAREAAEAIGHEQ